MDELKAIDQALFLELNGYHNPFWDAVMVLISNKYVWFPFYGVLAGLLIYFNKRRGLLMVLCLGASVGLADFISSGILKPYFARLRPCHDQLINANVNFVDGCGGLYGFVSSHAANAFAVAIFVIFLLPKKQWVFKGLLLVWAMAISYSRVYLGVHYPGDITAGALIGVGTAWLSIYIYRLLSKKYVYWQQ
ncbi:phosphatase PAP2 family protein [Rufibacter glacialis]|uniref:Phosphatase PAP2 family protein n=1 Tax=Rufibacter glacialis TaxID=1259555 RepID=A0A5M8QH75_9BACT|nr:phosphatase PAP2 family protein [Rufibacter glacialis]KAA6434280.1 phosphatase PAP2 family protein [Rufibacter glacialis]GGK68246.1 lipid A 4'-phosphatase [Rufibacter glacialis]